MPWKESSVMEERLRFIARLLAGEPMSDVCRAFGVSRKTGYKLLNRYREEGPIALCDRSRRPVRYANQLPEPVVRLIVDTPADSGGNRAGAGRGQLHGPRGEGVDHLRARLETAPLDLAAGCPLNLAPGDGDLPGVVHELVTDRDIVLGDGVPDRSDSHGQGD